MLFNSYLFIFLFLPVTFFLFFYTAKNNHKAALSILCIASLIFYSWNNYYFGGLLLFSILVNFNIAKFIIRNSSKTNKQWLLCAGVIFNLGLLGFFKYSNFFIQNINETLSAHLNLLNIGLPLGISFFTFTQIAFLVDSYKGLVEKIVLLNYALFVTYFPHLIAGPIIHHAELMPQMEKAKTFKINFRNVWIGLTIFAIGLFKKVVLAEYLSNYVIPIFDAHFNGISTADAWIGALAYTFELYFDFSGYSDMAIGLSLLFNMKLPINFYSPYKAANIIEFWRCWNITLSRFLRDYLYIPLGGNRCGWVRKYGNLVATMLLGGLWHGANWTFVIWGLLHGIYLCINHAWLGLKQYLGFTANENSYTAGFARLITFMLVIIAWVFFRAPDFSTAFTIIHAMFGKTSASWYLPNVLQIFSAQKILSLLFISMLIIFGLPNTYQLMYRFRNTFFIKQKIIPSRLWLWQPNLVWSTLTSFMLVFGVVYIQSSSTFLYFNF